MRKYIFYIFYSEKKKIYYNMKNTLPDMEKIHEIIKRRMKFSEKNIIDLNFDEEIKEKRLIAIYYRYGNLDIFSDKYKKMILKIANGSDNSEYYEPLESTYSQYHLDLIQLNSFLSELKKHYAEEIQKIRKEIKITWLFG